MFKATKEIIKLAAQSLQTKTSICWIIKVTDHFEERMIERFDEVEYPILEKVIEKALEKSGPGLNRYTHPLYGITVVINKMGLNGGELVTCWKGDENA